MHIEEIIRMFQHQTALLESIDRRLIVLERKLDEATGQTARGKGLLGDKMLYSVEEARRRLSISRTRLYELIGNGDLEVRKIGRRTLITPASVERLTKSGLNTGVPERSGGTGRGER